MSIDVTVSGLSTIVDVSVEQPTNVEVGMGQGVPTDDYNSLVHKPTINSVMLIGNKTSSDSGVADAIHTHTTSDVTDFPSLATVATTGDYDDLTDKPTIPDAVSVTQITSTGTNIADIDIGGVTTHLYAPSGGGGATAFVAEFNVTPYADVKDAYDNDAIVIGTIDDSGNTMVLQLVYFDATNEVFYFAFPMSDGWYWTQLSNADGWDDGQWYFASTDTATQLADGLMSALDKQKLDGLSKRNIWYGTCSTSASSSPKEITTASGDFSLTAGNMLVVLFSHTNSLSSVSLQVDGGTAKAAYPMDGTSDISNRWGSSEVVMFAYDGSKFIMLEQGKASTTAYGITKLNNTTSSTSTTEAATANAVKTAYDLASGKSAVSVSQITTTGTNIADITIDGSTTHLYAPTGASIIDALLPVGSYYETSDSTFDPNISWVGTWVLETEGQVHVSAGTNYPVSGALTNTSDGGAATHTLTTDEMPSHDHNGAAYYDGIKISNGAYGGSGSGQALNTAATGNHSIQTASTGGGQAHNNMQPHINVYRWHRTA